jgi:hypothetical protein
MEWNVGRELVNLPRMTVKQLRQRYAEVFGEETNANNKAWLVKRIAWRIQALAEGDLSERARRRAAELANDADLRLNPPRTDLRPEAGDPRPSITAISSPPLSPGRPGDSRLPPPGTILTRKYKGGVVQVMVLPHGFEYEGKVYKSLSAVAKAVTGSHCNGYLFFRLGGPGSDA